MGAPAARPQGDTPLGSREDPLVLPVAFGDLDRLEDEVGVAGRAVLDLVEPGQLLSGKIGAAVLISRRAGRRSPISSR